MNNDTKQNLLGGLIILLVAILAFGGGMLVQKKLNNRFSNDRMFGPRFANQQNNDEYGDRYQKMTRRHNFKKYKMGHQMRETCGFNMDQRSNQGRWNQNQQGLQNGFDQYIERNQPLPQQNPQ